MKNFLGFFPKGVLLFSIFLRLYGCTSPNAPMDSAPLILVQPTSINADLNKSCFGATAANLIPPKSCDLTRTTTEIPANGLYSVSAFGCWTRPDGSIEKDPDDNCEFACDAPEIQPPYQSGADCQAKLKWFAAGSDRYGCGAHIKVTNCENGRSVILLVLDKGPDCGGMELRYKEPILDISYPAMQFLFDQIFGAIDRKIVYVEKVEVQTILGPVE